MTLELFDDDVWQMSLGERAAVEGVLAQIRPTLAVEIGSMEGACLRRIAAYSKEVHSFDLRPPSLSMPENVVLHTGDSHELLPRFLESLASRDLNVDFVMVDGDHSSAGVQRDIEDLLDSRATAQTVMLIHDTANERVRLGADAVRYSAWPKVAHVELDWVPGQLFAEPSLRNELWCGLGLIRVDSSRLAYGSAPIYQQRYQPAAYLLAQARNLMLARQAIAPAARNGADEPENAEARIAELEAELGARLAASERVTELQDELLFARRRIEALEAESRPLRQRVTDMEAALTAASHKSAGAERALDSIKGSVSWKMTEPLRSVKQRVRGIKS